MVERHAKKVLPVFSARRQRRGKIRYTRASPAKAKTRMDLKQI